MQKERYETILQQCLSKATCIVVSKQRSIDEITAYYQLGQKAFGENRVKELLLKYETMPKDIEWHMIGHLQSNKAKYIAPFITCIHSVDSLSLAKEINKQALKYQRTIPILLQFNIALEETKSGFLIEEWQEVMSFIKTLSNIDVQGIMVMGPHCDDSNTIKEVFHQARQVLDTIQLQYPSIQQLSMGMSHDYVYALEEGATILRIGSILF